MLDAREEAVLRFHQHRIWGPIIRGISNNLSAWWSLEENFDEDIDAVNAVPPNSHSLATRSVLSASAKLGKGARFVFEVLPVGMPVVFKTLTGGTAAPFLFDSDRTVAFWINFSSFNTANAIFWKSLPFGGSEYSCHVDQATKKLVINETIFHSQALETGIWYFVTLTYRRADHFWSIKIDDGAPTEGINSVIASGVPFTIGNDAEFVFDGVIDEFAIWERILTADELFVLYNDGMGLTFSDLDVHTCRSLTCCEAP